MTEVPVLITFRSPLLHTNSVVRLIKLPMWFGKLKGTLHFDRRSKDLLEPFCVDQMSIGRKVRMRRWWDYLHERVPIGIHADISDRQHCRV